MGTGAQLVDFSAYEKVVLGWLPAQPHVSAARLFTLTPASRAAKNAHAVIVDSAIGEFWLEYLSDPFKGLLVRFVDTLHPSAPFAAAPILIENPVHRGRDWIARGETFRAEQIFKVRLVTAGTKTGQIRFAWTDRVAPTAPSLLSAEPGASSGTTRLIWTPSVERGSGIAYYTVAVDGRAVMRVDGTEATLPTAPGPHTISVTAVDRAGNRSLPSEFTFVGA
jgi:hypothetical protein